MLPSTPGQCPPQWLESPYGCDAKRNASHAARQPMAGMPGVPHHMAAHMAGVPQDAPEKVVVVGPPPPLDLEKVVVVVPPPSNWKK